jgi:hypothetical protein
MAACRSAGPNELTTSSVVGAIDGEASGIPGDFDGLCSAAPDGVCAARFAAKMKIANVACKNREITIISRC